MPKSNLVTSKFFQKQTQNHPLTIIDVGARGGIPREWEKIQNQIQAYCFEPDTTEAQRLQNSTPKNIHFIPKGLAEKTGPKKLHINTNPATSSIYPTNPAYTKRFPLGQELQTIKTIDIDCCSLDQVATAEKFPDIDFIKLDTQGSELDILKGGAETLKNSFGVFIEVEFLEIYQNQPTFPEVDQFLRSQNFTLFNLKPAQIFRSTKTLKLDSKGQIAWGHALYLKDFITNPELLQNTSPTKALKSIAIAELYGHTDFAIELTNFFHEKNIIDQNSYTDTINLLNKNTLPGKFAKILHRIKNLHYLFR